MAEPHQLKLKLFCPGFREHAYHFEDHNRHKGNSTLTKMVLPYVPIKREVSIYYNVSVPHTCTHVTSTHSSKVKMFTYMYQLGGTSSSL